MQNTVLEINKTDWKQTRLVTEALPHHLEEGQVLLRVDRQALTANNISYITSGDALGYWKFFPAQDADWGRFPTMGWADVLRSAHPDVAEGERVWGFFPLATHLLIEAGKVKSASFSDVSAHREGLAPVYAQFDRASANPLYEPEREDQDSLLRGLFMTSWLVEDFLTVNDQFGANSCVITSASSKTSIALGHCVKSRGALKSVGVTSAGNLAFCQGLGCYDTVITYDEISTLDSAEPAVLVDMAGGASILTAIHEHFGDALKHSCRIGMTHYEDFGPVDGLPGAKPTFFFAPHHVQSRSAELGTQELMMQLGMGFAGFRVFCDSWLQTETHRGPEAVEATYQSVLAGSADPAVGQIVAMHQA